MTTRPAAAAAGHPAPERRAADDRLLVRRTLAGTAYGPIGEPTASEQLAMAGFQVIGTGAAKGHPCFVANDGRSGAGGHRAHTPGAAAGSKPARPDARRERATFPVDAGPGPGDRRTRGRPPHSGADGDGPRSGPAFPRRGPNEEPKGHLRHKSATG
ncbi:MAG TPA: hypothetical protein VN520_06325 [Streptomyces sp.]|uniref:hypothetical protein n=1 Tax=Streptomyces sp. TaxID=1931 RepID=UPI002D016E59|nr:hypothetical protein [Streptomyces sp.]HWU05998.1 hypothetical protein [Streptomyces sp.]